MSTNLGRINSNSFTRFWGGADKGVSIQITGYNGYVQLSAGEIIAALPVLKSIIDCELKRRKSECEDAIKENKDLQKTIVNDMRQVADMAIAQPVLDMASLLNLTNDKIDLEDAD